MISMSKLEMINYIRDYAYLQERFVVRGEKNFFDSFQIYMKATKQYDKLSIDYYNTMLRTYNAYINFRMYSIVEDYYLNRDDNISNNDLDSFVHNCKFIEKPSNMTNKRLLELIRNSFCHSLDKALKISKNAKNFELDIEDIRYPRQISKGGNKEPLKMRFNLDYLSDLSNLFAQKGRNVLFTSYVIPKDFNINSKNLFNELDKIKFEHYYFDKKLDVSISDRLKKLNKINSISNLSKLIISRKLHNLASSINPSTLFDLTDDQKKKIVLTIKQYKESNPELIDETVENVMFFLLNDVIPVPGLKLLTFTEYRYYLSLQTDENMLSFNQLVKVLAKSISSLKPYETVKTMRKNDKLNLLRHLANADFIQGVPYIMYLDAVVNNLCEEDEIIIDGITYDRNRLRNSLTHCRWYIGENSKLHLFDANPKNKYDYDLYDIGKIDLRSFIKWADNYVFSKEKENNKKLIYKK